MFTTNNMKNKLFILGLVFIASTALLHGQESYNKWSVGANIGVHDGTCLPLSIHVCINCIIMV